MLEDTSFKDNITPKLECQNTNIERPISLADIHKTATNNGDLNTLDDWDNHLKPRTHAQRTCEILAEFWDGVTYYENSLQNFEKNDSLCLVVFTDYQEFERYAPNLEQRETPILLESLASVANLVSSFDVKSVIIVSRDAQIINSLKRALKANDSPAFIQYRKSMETTIRSVNDDFHSNVFDPLMPQDVPCRASSHIPQMEYLYGKHYVRGEVGITTASPATGKSYLNISEVFEMLKSNFEYDRDNPDGLRVQIWSEDPVFITEARLHAIAQHHGLLDNLEQIVEGLFINSFRTTPFSIVKKGESGVLEKNGQVVETIIEGLRANYIDLIVFDTLSHVHNVNENSNDDMDVVFNVLKHIASKANCAVEVIHHNAKGAYGASLDNARGASSIAAKVRTARSLTPMSAHMLKSQGGDGLNRYFKVTDTKRTHGGPLENDGTWYKRESITIGNGENMAVVVPYTPKQKSDGPEKTEIEKQAPPLVISQEAKAATLAELSTRRHRFDRQAKDWAGHILAKHAKIPSSEFADRPPIQALLKDWQDEGLLVSVETKHPKKNDAKLWWFEVPNKGAS